MYPAVRQPKGLARPVDFKLRSGWRYDDGEGAFHGPRGARFMPTALPKKTRIVYKTPTLAKADPKGLSRAERDLQRYMQVILPSSHEPGKYVPEVESWPCVEEAHPAPEVSLPTASPRKAGR